MWHPTSPYKYKVVSNRGWYVAIGLVTSPFLSPSFPFSPLKPSTTKKSTWITRPCCKFDKTLFPNKKKMLAMQQHEPVNAKWSDTLPPFPQYQRYLCPMGSCGVVRGEGRRGDGLLLRQRGSISLWHNRVNFVFSNLQHSACLKALRIAMGLTVNPSPSL